jgi:hypothetical protein
MHRRCIHAAGDLQLLGRTCANVAQAVFPAVCWLLLLPLTPLQVMPYNRHKEAAALELGADGAPVEYQAALDSEAELPRVVDTLRELHSTFYEQLDRVSGVAACACDKGF